MGPRAALAAILGAGLLAVPFLGMRLVPGVTGDRLAFDATRPLIAAGATAALLAGVAVLRALAAGRVGAFVAGLGSLVTGRAAPWAALAAAAGFPFLPDPWVAAVSGWGVGRFHPLGWLSLETLSQLWLSVVLALGLNLMVGQTGVLVLGYGGFHAVGAYAMALLTAGLPVAVADGIRYDGFLPYWPALGLGIAAGALLAAGLGVVVGFPALRLKGDYLAIVTLGFGEVMVLVLKNWGSVTGGNFGVNITPVMLKPLRGSWAYPDAVWHYGLSLAAAVLAIVFHSRLNASRLGRALVAVREDETAARAMGIDATRLKLTAFAIAAAWAGVAGALFAARLRFVTPESFTFIESITLLVMVVLGGMGNLRGVVLGALGVTVLMESLREAGAYRMLVFGALLVAMMIVRPQGLLRERRGAAR